MPQNGTVAYVLTFPACDIHKYQMHTDNVEAHYDGRTVYGSWANMCDECYRNYGVGLGIGHGQRLEIRPQ